MISLSQETAKSRHTDNCSEVQLLLCLSRNQLSATAIAKARSIIQEAAINWEYVLQLADQHGVMALLHQSLTTVCPGALPASVTKQLQRNFQIQALRNLFLTGELYKILELLKDRGIPAIAFRGAALAVMLYGNTSLHKFSALDILVAEQDFDSAHKFLLMSGYQPVVESESSDVTQEIATLKSNNPYSLLHQNGLTSINLHCRLVTGDSLLMPIHFEPLWEFDRLAHRLKPMVIAGKTLPSLNAEDLLLHLCVYGSSHLWTHLSLICDIAELLRVYPKLNWNWLWQQAETIGCERMLTVGLLLAHRLLEAPLPKAVLEKIQADLHSDRLATRVQRWLVRTQAVPTQALSWERVRFHLDELKTLPDKVEYCCRSLVDYGLTSICRGMMLTFNSLISNCQQFHIKN
jgi:hypothetical protein